MGSSTLNVALIQPRLHAPRASSNRSLRVLRLLVDCEYLPGSNAWLGNFTVVYWHKPCIFVLGNSWYFFPHLFAGMYLVGRYLHSGVRQIFFQYSSLSLASLTEKNLVTRQLSHQDAPSQQGPSTMRWFPTGGSLLLTKSPGVWDLDLGGL
jgi:hypothetical protein